MSRFYQIRFLATQNALTFLLRKKNNICHRFTSPVAVIALRGYFFPPLVSLVLQEEVLAGVLLLRVLDRVHLVDARPEIVGIPSERNFQRLQELVHPAQKGLRRVCLGGDRWSTLEHDHSAKKKGKNEETKGNF